MKQITAMTIAVGLAVGALVLPVAEQPRMSAHFLAAEVPVASIFATAFAGFVNAAKDLWEIVHTNELGVWHLVVVVLAVLIPRKIVAMILR